MPVGRGLPAKRKEADMRRLTIVLMAALLAVASSSAVFGGWLDFGKSLEGTVAEVEEGLLIITQHDRKSNTISEVSVEIDRETKFEKVESLARLKEGDRVKIEYTEENEKKVATLIAKIEPENTKEIKM
jgi:hypothetical protein